MRAKDTEKHEPFMDLEVIQYGWSTKMGVKRVNRYSWEVKEARFALQITPRPMENHRRG